MLGILYTVCGNYANKQWVLQLDSSLVALSHYPLLAPPLLLSLVMVAQTVRICLLCRRPRLDPGEMVFL